MGIEVSVLGTEKAGKTGARGGPGAKAGGDPVGELAPRAVAESPDRVSLVFDGEYEAGDVLRIRTTDVNRHLVLCLDDTLAPTMAYLSGYEFRFPVPFAEARGGYSPRAFTGARHLLTARYATDAEIAAYRNLALNPHDHGGNEALFPRAEANIVTRGETVFAARNAIDGLTASDGHGEWPWTSWGINRDPAARLTVRFGRPVRVDRAAVFIRTDFPHDAWWESATLRFSDGSEIPVRLEKRAGAQVVEFPARVAEWVSVDTLVKADDPSPFPALTQLEIWGTEA